MTSQSRRKRQITAPTRLAKAIRIKRLVPSRASLLATAVAAGTMLPNFLYAEQPQPSLFQNSIAAQARPISRSQQQTESRGTDAQWAEIRKRKVGASSTTLRWQTPKNASAVQPASHVAPAVSESKVDAKPKLVANKVLTWGQDDKKTSRGQVRLVTQLGPLDPFDDPFGDRDVRINEPVGRAFVSQPKAQAVPPTDDGPAEVIGEPEFAPQADGRMADEADTQDLLNDLAPEPEPRPAPFREAAPEPPASDDLEFRSPIPAPRRPYQPSPDCDRVYNERDCCADGELCRNARHRVKENTIDQIDINISPSYKPDATTQDEADQARTLRLAQSAIRSWRNRDGEVVARGQMRDVKFGQLYLEHEGNVTKIPIRELSDDDWCFLAAWWGVPTECSLGDDEFQQRAWLASTMTWKASGACHKPLYFEEVQLERYGHTVGPLAQPVVSGAHFFLNIATLPYQMGISPPNECEYALGYYRPGSCAPWLLPPVPLSVRGALMEAGAIVGGIYIIP